jgi:DNA-binding response OmpR family regulator
MAAHPQLPDRTVFGSFEINAAAGELKKSGIRIRLSGQPMRILLALLARPGDWLPVSSCEKRCGAAQRMLISTAA